MNAVTSPAFLTDLDNQVFTILTALSSGDKTSFLRVQRLVRSTVGDYAYLEIGSEMGGSLIPHLLDPACIAAVSIDLRPQSMPDERGTFFDYPDNSTAKMRQTLAAHLGQSCLDKLSTFDSDASQVAPASLPHRFDLAMIDGEHTTIACFSDFVSVLAFLKPDAVVAFHDSNLIADAIQNCEKFLSYLKVPYSTVFLPDCVAVIGLRGMASAVDELAVHALERTDYLARSRKSRWIAVARSMIEAGELTELQAAKADLATSIERNQVLDQELVEMRQALALGAKRLSSGQASMEELSAQLRAAEHRISALQKSSSWRVTAPLRALAERFRK